MEKRYFPYSLTTLGVLAGVLSAIGGSRIFGEMFVRFPARGMIGEVKSVLVYLYLYIGPGVVFGVLTAVFFAVIFKKRIAFLSPKILGWIVFSTAGYCAAFFSQLGVMYLTDFLEVGRSFARGVDFLLPFISGIVGASLLAVGFHLFFVKMNGKQVVTLILLGGILGFAFYWDGIVADLTLLENGALLPYVLWQGGVAFFLERMTIQHFSRV